MRIYIVRNGDDLPVLVRAANRAQAMRHVAARKITVELATQDDLVRMIGAQYEVEECGSEQPCPE